VTFEILDNGSGSISPLTATTTHITEGGVQKSVASTTYTRSATATASTIKLRAKAIVPGAGGVYSSDATLGIGAPAGYTLALDCSVKTNNRCETTSGSTTGLGLTATLKYNNGLTSNVVINLASDLTGDSLTPTNPSTVNGVASSVYRAGANSGQALVTATAPSIPGLTASLIIYRGSSGGGGADATNTLMFAVPYYVPITSVNANAYSEVTVLVRNSSGGYVSGQAVTLTSSRGALDTITTINATSDSKGRARFNIKSNTVGVPTLTAVIGGFNKTTTVSFVNDSTLTTAALDVTVPLQGRSYDRAVMLYLREVATGVLPTVRGVFFTDATTNKVLDLPPVYLKNISTYKCWAKGQYHLARVRDLAVSATPTLNFSYVTSDQNVHFEDNVGGGLLVADLIDARGSVSDPGTTAYNHAIFPAFGDNIVGLPDFTRWAGQFSLSTTIVSDIADVNNDGHVNLGDLSILLHSWSARELPLPQIGGVGALLP